MSLLSRWAIVIFVFSAFIYGVTQWRQANQTKNDVIDSAETPDFIAESLKSAIYSDDGILSHEIQADRMEHYTHLKLTHFERPNYTLYPKNSDSPWYVSAKEATLYDNNNVILKNTIRITSTQADSLVREIHGKKLTLDLNTNIISSEQAVTVYGNSFTMIGTGLVIDLNTKQMTLTEHDQTTYEKNNS